MAGSAGNALKTEVVGEGEPDLLVVEHVNSAFHGTPDLHAWLQGHDHPEVTVCGITTDHCCGTTARMAGNLGYRTTFIIDATCTFDRRALDGGWVTADEIARVTAANLDGELAAVLTTQQLLAATSGAEETVAAR